MSLDFSKAQQSLDEFLKLIEHSIIFIKYTLQQNCTRSLDHGKFHKA
jgi:hypothetical protein